MQSISTLIPEIVNNCDDKIELDLQNVSKEKITSALTEATDHRFVTLPLVWNLASRLVAKSQHISVAQVTLTEGL